MGFEARCVGPDGSRYSGTASLDCAWTPARAARRSSPTPPHSPSLCGSRRGSGSPSSTGSTASRSPTGSTAGSGDAMPWRPSRGHWKMSGGAPVSATQVAARLARLEIIDDLRYRDVHVEADAVDVTPCHETAADAFFRFYRLRPVGWSPVHPACDARTPGGVEERADPHPAPGTRGLQRRSRARRDRVRRPSFLCRVERDIDALLLHAKERARERARR